MALYIYDPDTETLGIFPYKTGSSSFRTCLGNHGRYLVDGPVAASRTVMSCRHPETRFNSLWTSKIPVCSCATPIEMAEEILAGVHEDDGHYTPQSWAIDGVPDILIRFESLARDYDRAKKYFPKARVYLAHRNASEKKADVFSRLPHTIKKELWRYYRDDYALFGYRRR